VGRRHQSETAKQFRGGPQFPRRARLDRATATTGTTGLTASSGKASRHPRDVHRLLGRSSFGEAINH
jgi:hypothetical protein